MSDDKRKIIDELKAKIKEEIKMEKKAI